VIFNYDQLCALGHKVGCHFLLVLEINVPMRIILSYTLWKEMTYATARLEVLSIGVLAPTKAT
jgi:hypothetical protein